MRRKKRYSRRKRIIIAYTARAVVALVFAGMMFLMFCGCRYLYDQFHKEEPAENAGADTVYAGIDNVFSPAKGDIGSIETIAGGDEQENKGEYSGLTIVLDAGHGGNDSGTFCGSIYEKDITLEVTKQMQELFEKQGVTVSMTREKDVYLGLEERTDAANSIDADLFVSIHCNFYEKDDTVRGLECYYQESSKKGKEYAEGIMDILKQNGNIRVREAKPEDYYVIRYTKAPAVLVELGYLSNRTDRGLLTDPDYQEQLAEGLVDGILQCLGGV